MQFLGMIPRERSMPSKVLQEAVREVRIRVNSGGFFIPAVDSGDTVEKGTTLGEIRDITDAVREYLISPIGDAVVRLLYTIGAVNTGDPVMVLWQTKSISFPE
jgi:predicted deacylase